MTRDKKSLLLGTHVSIAGGPEQAIYRGEAIGCTAIQIFTKSNRQWLAKPLEQEEIDAFRKAWNNSTIQSVIAHAAYLINIGSSNPETVKKSTQSLAIELERCQQLGIPYLVLHPGSRGDLSEKECLQQITQQLDTVLESTPGNTILLLETMAGQGSNMCYRFEQIASIYQESRNKERLGVCFDTCHVFAAGYDLRTEETYQAVWNEFDTIIGLHLLKAIHINDSKKELNSHVDRHEHIGKGELGSNAFQLLFNDERFFDIPKILETPKKRPEDDLHNIQTIKGLVSTKNRDFFST